MPPPPSDTTTTMTGSPPPGPRASKFCALWERALAATLRSISYDAFAACFPTVAACAPSSLRAMHGALVERLETFAKSDFEAILAERSVLANLNALDLLIADATRRKARAVSADVPVPAPVPPHQQPPAALLAAHLAPLLAHEQSQLNARLQTVQGQNARLFASMRAQRAEMDGLLDGLRAAVADLEVAGEKLDIVVADVGRDMRTAEAEMAEL